MICAYCGKEAKGTKEHIVSCAILDLFPECYITHDASRKRIYAADPMVNDVCADCNNKKLSYIDSYAKRFIEKYFMRTYEENDSLEIEYEYTMIQKMLLKYAYNDMRSRKEDCSFFNEEMLAFLTDITIDIPKDNVTVLCGLAVNTSPMPDFMTGNFKLQWAKNPFMYANSSIRNIDYNTGQVFLSEEVEKEEFPDLEFSYVFRFNSVQFLLFCWKKDSENIERNNVILKLQYPYRFLEKACEKTKLPICTDEVNYHRIEHIHVNWDGLNEIQTMRKVASGGEYKFKKDAEKEWQMEEEKIAKEHPRKR